MSEIDEIVDVWQEFAANLTDWQPLVADTQPKETQCGPIYEPENPLGRPETFAVSDMRGVKLATPHYHDNNETEMYFVLSGSGTTVVGDEVREISRGSVVIIRSDTAHYTIPKEDLVMIVSTIQLSSQRML